MSHKIYITGEINDDSYRKFSKQLGALERRLKTNTIIDIILFSDGGSAYAALAFYDRILQTKLEVRITGTGCVMSAATLILAAGAIRRMTRNSWAMVHEDTSGTTKNMRVTLAESTIKHSREMEAQWNELLERHTGTSTKIWERLNKEETYLSAEWCLKLGLIQEIV